MGDMGDFWRDVKENRRERREKLGIECPGCRKVQPKRTPTLLMPHMRCKVCGTTYHQAKQPLITGMTLRTSKKYAAALKNLGDKPTDGGEVVE